MSTLLHSEFLSSLWWGQWEEKREEAIGDTETRDVDSDGELLICGLSMTFSLNAPTEVVKQIIINIEAGVEVEVTIAA